MPSFNAFQHPNRVGITAPSGDSSDRLATTEFTQTAIQAVLAGFLPSGLHALAVVVSSTPYTVGNAEFSLTVATGANATLNLPTLGQNRVLVVLNDNGEGVYSASSNIFIPGLNAFSSQIVSSAQSGEWNWVILHDNGGGWVKIAAGQQGWQFYTPTYSAQINSSAIAQSTVTGLFQKNGTLVNYQVNLVSTSSGIGSSMGFALFSLPINIDASLPGPLAYGREGVTQKMLQGVGFTSSQMAVEFYDGTSPIAPGNGLNVAGWYRCVSP
jgi:hypothetical protein